jgi:hypothetical protein
MIIIINIMDGNKGQQYGQTLQVNQGGLGSTRVNFCQGTVGFLTSCQMGECP